MISFFSQCNEEKKPNGAQSSTSAIPQLNTDQTSSLSLGIDLQHPDDFHPDIAKDQAPGSNDALRFSSNDYDDVAFNQDYQEVNGVQDYLEVNGGQEGKYRAKRVPQIEIKRKVFPGMMPPSSMISSSNDSHELLNLETIGGMSSHSSFDGPGKGEPLTTDVLTSDAVTLTPKDAPSPLTPFLPNVPPNSPLPGGSFYMAQGSQVVSAVATMPRRKKDPEKFMTQVHHNASSKYGPLTISRNYKKVYDPTRIRPKPPTPPVRRLPSWVELHVYLQLSFII